MQGIAKRSLLFHLVVLFLLTSSTQGQDVPPDSAEYVRELENRIQALEESVRELKAQFAAPPAQQQSQQTTRSPASNTAPQPPAVSVDQPRDLSMKLSGYFFGDYYWMAKNHNADLEDQNGFWFRRLYLTFDKPLSESLDVRVRFEMNSPGDFFSTNRLSPFAKDLYLRWKFSDRHRLYLGLSPTPISETLDSFWGYRAVEKSISDLQRLGSTRDLGLGFQGDLDSDRKLRYHFQVGNGSGTAGEIDSGKKVSFSLGLYPSDSWRMEFYTDHNSLPGENNRQTFQGWVGYQSDRGRLGLLYAHQDQQGEPGLGLDALSLFGVLRVSQNMGLFGRYDRMFDPNPAGNLIAYLPFDPTAESNLFIAGLDLEISDQFSFLPNVEIVRYDQREDGRRAETDVVPRLTFYVRY